MRFDLTRLWFGLCIATLLFAPGCSSESIEAQQRKGEKAQAGSKTAKKKPVPIGTHIKPARKKAGNDQVAGGLRGVRIPVEAFKSVAYSHNGKMLAAGAGDGSVVVWETKNHFRIVHLQAHKNWAFDLVFSPDDDHLITAGGDNTVRTWDTKDWKLQQEYKGHEDDVHGIAVSDDSRFLVSGADDTLLRVHDVDTDDTHELAGHEEQVTSLTISSNGLIASGSRDDTIRLWDLKTRQPRVTIDSHSHDVLDVEFNADGSRVASVSYDGTLQIHATATGELQHTMIGHQDWAFAVAWSPDGKQLATGAADGTVRLWNAETGELQQMFVTGRDGAALTYSPNGDTLAVAFPKGRVEVYLKLEGRFGPRMAMDYGSSRRTSLNRDLATGFLDPRVYVQVHEDLLTDNHRDIALRILTQLGDEFSLKYMQSLQAREGTFNNDERERLAKAIVATEARMRGYINSQKPWNVVHTYGSQWLHRMAIAELRDSPIKGAIRAWTIDRIKPLSGHPQVRKALERIEQKFQLTDRRPTAIGIVARDGEAVMVGAEQGAVGLLEKRVRRLATTLLNLSGKAKPVTEPTIPRTISETAEPE